MRAPVGHDAIAGIGRIPPATIADDRIVGHTGSHRDGIDGVYEPALRRERIHAIGPALGLQLVFPDARDLQHFAASFRSNTHWADQRGTEPSKPATGEIAAAQGSRNKDDSPDFRAVMERRACSDSYARRRLPCR